MAAAVGLRRAYLVPWWGSTTGTMVHNQENCPIVNNYTYTARM